MKRIAKPEPGAEGAPALRRGWTTGACATAATKAALTALCTGAFPDPVSIALPKGETPAFPLACEARGAGWARAGIIKDAGDDPDVTHGALVLATVRFGAAGSGVVFRAGAGVGTVTKAGLPIPPGEPAINPVPRRMMRAVVEDIAARDARAGDVEIEIGVEGGEALALKTWNPRLGIVGGLSILGTTGIVHPFSCSAWIHSIHRGIDVARANGFARVAGATGSTSEAAAQALYKLPDEAMIDMGDFAGGMLKYLRNHPVPNVVVAGGFAKMSKLACGFLDLHSGRSQVDLDWLADIADRIASGEHGVGERGDVEGGAKTNLIAAIRSANTAAEVKEHCDAAGIDIALPIANAARNTVLATLKGAPVSAAVLVVGRDGEILAHAR